MAQKTQFDFSAKKEPLVQGANYCLPAEAFVDMSNILNDELPVRFASVAARVLNILACADSVEVIEKKAAPSAAPELKVEQAPESLEPEAPAEAPVAQVEAEVVTP